MLRQFYFAVCSLFRKSIHYRSEPDLGLERRDPTATPSPEELAEFREIHRKATIKARIVVEMFFNPTS